MPRNYAVACQTSFSDGRPLDAWTARTRIQTNCEAVYEEARDDGRVILPTYMSPSNTYTQFGPIAIRMTRDRDGNWRDHYFNILVAAGSAASMTFRGVITDTWRPPSLIFYSISPFYLVDDIDPYTDWTVGTGNTVAWRGDRQITIPRTWEPSIIARGSGISCGAMRTAWFSLWCMDVPPLGGTDPRIAGVHHYEVIGDEP